MLPTPRATRYPLPTRTRLPQRLIAALSVLTTLLAGCALDPARQLAPGSSAEDVSHVMGEPWAQWNGPDGVLHWVYPTGPLGRRTYEVQFDSGGKVRSVEDVLNDRGFARIQSGKSTEEDVRRLFGPPYRITRFERKHETAWDYYFRDAWTYPAIFSVMFDDKGIVATTMQQREFYGQHDSAH